MPSTFERLHDAIHNQALLLEAYDGVLKELFAKPFWNVGGDVAMQRIVWTDGRAARTEDRESFGSRGLYIWGVANRPLYIGIARKQSLKKRFNRYIWGKRSQCKLAKEFELKIITDGIDGFPPEIRERYRRQFRGGKARLEHAVQFAKEGIDRIWFALLSHHNPKEIVALEEPLVQVAESWNQRKGFRSLLNDRFNPHKIRPRNFMATELTREMATTVGLQGNKF